MSDQTILVTSADLDELANDMKTANGAIQNRLDQLVSELQKIFGAGWEGQSRVAFDQAHAQWNQEIGQMQDILTEAHANVTASQENYAASDKKAAGFF